MKTFSKSDKVLLFCGILGLVSILTVGIVYAWTNPSANPPGGGGALYYSGGNVGINTASPDGKLTVYDANNIGGIHINAAAQPIIRFQTAGSNKWGFIGNYGSTNGLSFYNYSGGGVLMELSANGNVGINTNNPGYRLDVGGDINVTGSYRINGTPLGSSQTIVAGNVSSGQFGSNTGGGNYSFPANVGIGVASPAYNLDVYNSGTAYLGNSAANSALIVRTGAGSYIDFQPGGTTSRMRLNTDGNVGIGVSNPTAKVDIRAGNSSLGFADWNGDAALYLDGADGDRIGGDYAVFRANSVGDLGIWTGSEEKITIKNSGGNVGIGTANPSAKLDVNGLISSQLGGSGTASTGLSVGGALNFDSQWSTWGAMRVGVNANNGTLKYTTSNGNGVGFLAVQDGAFYFDNGVSTGTGNNASLTTRLAVLANGNVGIGTTNPSLAKLQVAGGIRLDNAATLKWFTSAGGNGWEIRGGADDKFYVNNGGQDIVRFDNTNRSMSIGGVYVSSAAPADGLIVQGNVGIGTTNPGQKLSVAGTVESTSGGFKFPDGTTQTTAASGVGTINAANVSAGQFGGNTGGGNFSFPSGGTAIFNNVGGAIRLRKTAGVDSNDDLGIWGNGAPFYIADWNTGSKGIAINTSSGNVGINAVSPGEKLQVGGAILATGDYSGSFPASGVYLTNTSVGRIAALGTGGTARTLVVDGESIIFDTGSSYTEKMRINSTGNVGIGTSGPVYSLDVAGPGTPTVNIRGSNGQLYVNNIAPNSGTTIAFPAADLSLTPGYGLVSGGTRALAIGSSGNLTANGNFYVPTGNVGIGTASPSYKLDVAGDVNITGSYRVNGTPISTGGGINYQVFNSSGTFVVPTGVTKIRVQAWGGGGGGAPGSSYGAGGGGGGAFGEAIFTVTPGASFPVIVGAGGAGGVWGSTYGSPGGTSSFEGAVFQVAGGNRAEPVGNCPNSGTGGSNINISGGLSGVLVLRVKGNAGGSGDCGNIGGVGGQGAMGGNGGAVGAVGNSPGGGGGGGGGGNSNGAAGAAGQVIVYW